MIFFLFGIAILIADQLSKYWIFTHVPVAGSQWVNHQIVVFENFFGINFSIVHATNRGAAWGIFSEWQEYLLYLRILLIASLLFYIVFLNKRPAWRLPLVLITSGALGNVIDHFLYGHVIDMLHFNFWGYNYPSFNIADSAIFIGIFWLFILSCIEDSTKSIKKV